MADSSPFILVLEGPKIAIFTLCLDLVVCPCIKALGAFFPFLFLFLFFENSSLKAPLRSMRMGLFSRLVRGTFRRFLHSDKDSTYCASFLKWYRFFIDLGELQKCARHPSFSISFPFGEVPLPLPFPYRMVGFQFQVPRFGGIIFPFQSFFLKELSF